MKYKANRSTMIQHLIEYQIEMIGKTMVDTLSDDKWKFNWTMSRKQKSDFKAYAIPLIKKVFRCNGSKASITYLWFEEHLGLKTKD